MPNEYEVNPQDKHPSADGPTAEGSEDNPPKVDAGDTGAEVGTPGSAAEVTDAWAEQVGEVIAAPEGYLGHNPDSKDNADYTVAGQLGTSNEGEAAPAEAPAEEAPAEAT